MTARAAIKIYAHAVATIDDSGNATYSKPVPMPGAVSLSLDPESEPTKFYADGYAYYIINNNMGYEGDLWIISDSRKNFRMLQF